jgi:hypothetical protein
MPEALTPKLSKITVDVGMLILDPNNPRLVTDDSNLCPEEDFIGVDLTGQTFARMSGGEGANDPFRIEQIVSSIRQNGWQPVDFIFVRRITNDDRYVVLEGNRRITALRKLLQEKGLDPDLRAKISRIEVMEVMDEGDPAILKRKISYLLGVRHHGSLRRWSAFAQAKNIYEHYLKVSGQNRETFAWHPQSGEKVAAALSIKDSAVKERLKVYRAMEQLDTVPSIAEGEGGITGRYYSVCAELVLRNYKALSQFIPQDGTAFLLDDEGIKRIDNLCHFSQPNRAGAPIRNPQEWRYLDKILDLNKDSVREEMLAEVTEAKRFPSEVWAEIESNFQQLQWDHWLGKVHSVVSKITLQDDLQSEAAKAVGSRLFRLVDELDTLDQND